MPSPEALSPKVEVRPASHYVAFPASTKASSSARSNNTRRRPGNLTGVRSPLPTSRSTVRVVAPRYAAVASRLSSLAFAHQKT